MLRAVLKGDSLALKVTLDCGVDPATRFGDTYNNGTALHLAVKLRFRQCCQILLHKNAHIVDIMDETGQTPLHIAATIGDLDIVTLLVSAGADTSCKDFQGKTPTYLNWYQGADIHNKDNTLYIIVPSSERSIVRNFY
jgi:ankyrin repeat protein